MMQETGNALSEVLLERLEDIHGAVEPSWWPPAPGWWIVGALVVVALAWLAARLASKIRAHVRRRRMLRTLEALVEEHDPKAQPADYLGAMNRFFRGVALRAFPESRCARLQGEAWVGFIRERLPGGGSDVLDALASGPYRPDPDFDAAELHAQARRWVMSHG